jgi:uncharacterized spore protein YtfJ
MATIAPFESIADVLNRGLNIHHVYGEPVQRGDTTVIPVAKVAYGFGAGGGRGPGHARRHGEPNEQTVAHDERADAEGAGGGGGVRMTPAGALELGPNGTRFVLVHPFAPIAAAVATGALFGSAIVWLMRKPHLK